MRRCALQSAESGRAAGDRLARDSVRAAIDGRCLAPVPEVDGRRHLLQLGEAFLQGADVDQLRLRLDRIEQHLAMQHVEAPLADRIRHLLQRRGAVGSGAEPQRLDIESESAIMVNRPVMDHSARRVRCAQPIRQTHRRAGRACRR